MFQWGYRSCGNPGRITDDKCGAPVGIEVHLPYFHLSIEFERRDVVTRAGNRARIAFGRNHMRNTAFCQKCAEHTSAGTDIEGYAMCRCLEQDRRQRCRGDQIHVFSPDWREYAVIRMNARTQQRNFDALHPPFMRADYQWIGQRYDQSSGRAATGLASAR